MDTHTGGLRERIAPSWQFESLLWGISSGFPLANHFDLPGSKSVFSIAQDFPMWARASLSQDGFYRRSLRVGLATWHHSPFDLQGALLHMCSREGLLTSRMKNMWSLIFYLGRAQLPLSIVLLFSFWSIGPQGTNSNCLPRGPIYLLPQIHVYVSTLCSEVNIKWYMWYLLVHVKVFYKPSIYLLNLFPGFPR